MKFIVKILCRILFNKEEMFIAKYLNYGRVLLLNWIVQRVFGNCPSTRFSVNFTSKVNGNSKNLIIVGNATSILTSLATSGGCYISIHDGTKLTIGEGTIWASNVAIVTGNHELMNRDKHTISDVIIGKNCWLAKGVTLLPGVILGNNVTVGANSVVTKSFEDNCVIAGIPAKIIKKI